MTQQPRSGDSFPMWPVLALLGMFGVLLVIVLAGNVTRTVPLTPTPAATATEVAQVPTATMQPVEVAASGSYDPLVAAQGRNTFLGTCAACHGPDAQGITGLGKNLVTSEFVHSLTDDELLAFIQKGRQVFDPANTTGVEMPPRGGNPGLSDNDLRNIIVYLRSIGGPPTVSDQPTAAAPTAAPTAASSEPTREFVIPGASIGSTPVPATQLPAAREFVNVGANISATPGLPPPPARTGQDVYNWNCAGCHGANGEGVPSDGPALTASALPADSAALKALLNAAISDPTTGFTHPYDGGYPAISDEELNNLLEYLHSLAH